MNVEKNKLRSTPLLLFFQPATYMPWPTILHVPEPMRRTCLLPLSGSSVLSSRVISSGSSSRAGSRW